MISLEAYSQGGPEVFNFPSWAIYIGPVLISLYLVIDTLLVKRSVCLPSP